MEYSGKRVGNNDGCSTASWGRTETGDARRNPRSEIKPDAIIEKKTHRYVLRPRPTAARASKNLLGET